MTYNLILSLSENDIILLLTVPTVLLLMLWECNGKGIRISEVLRENIWFPVWYEFLIRSLFAVIIAITLNYYILKRNPFDMFLIVALLLGDYLWSNFIDRINAIKNRKQETTIVIIL